MAGTPPAPVATGGDPGPAGPEAGATPSGDAADRGRRVDPGQRDGRDASIEAARWTGQARRGAGRGRARGRGGGGGRRDRGGRCDDRGCWRAAGTGATAPAYRRRVDPGPGRTAVDAAGGDQKRAGRAPAAIPAARVVADTPAVERDRPAARAEPAGRAFRPSIGRTPIVIGLAVVALALVVGGAAAYLYLPTATAVISPREATIGPESLRIVASTTATEPDPNASPPVVPAQLLTVEVEASDEFPATGKRIEEAKAKGSVRFDNLDPTSSNTIAKGAVVSTGSGVRFRTDRAVTDPARRARRPADRAVAGFRRRHRGRRRPRGQRGAQRDQDGTARRGAVLPQGRRIRRRRPAASGPSSRASRRRTSTKRSPP